MPRSCMQRLAFAAISAASLAGILFSSYAGQAQAIYQLPTTQTIFPVGNTPLGVASADFSLNGFQGVVVSDNKSNQITIFVGSGPGAFQPSLTSKTCTGPTAVLATDMNGDGYPDIAVACPTANTVDVFLNNGSGGFPVNPSGIVTVTDPVAMVAGDFTNSGQISIAVAGGSGNVTVLGNIGASYSTTQITIAGGFSGITTADLNHDGNLDLALSDSTGSKVDVLFGDGSGNFSPSGSYAVGSNPSGIASADFNHDGNPDLAVTNAGGNNVSILLGSATGTFTVESTAPAAGTDPIAIAVTDANGDGNPDIIAFDAAIGNTTTQGSVAILLGTSTGTFQPALIEDLSDVPGSEAAVADFNRDGKPDMAIVERTEGYIALLFDNLLPTQYPDGRSFAALNALSNGYGNMADSVAVGDFNQDGLQDIAVSYLEDNTVQVLTNNGNGFNTPKVYSVGHQPYFIASGDFNGDGYADLVTANTTDGTVSVLLNKGATAPGTFLPAVPYSVGKQPYQVAIGDLNDDGIPDLAVTNYGANTVSILYGKKGGTFTPGPTLSTGSTPYGVVIGDFQHDGYPDIAVTCFQSNQLDVFVNNKGTFAPAAIYDTNANPAGLVVGDFNRDGNLDLVVGNTTSNNVSFFAGNGKGSFAAGITSPALNFPNSLAAGDINGDGILDIVSSAPTYNQVAVTLGNGDGSFGTFQQRAAFNVGNYPEPWAVALGDFNNDGHLDIVTANTAPVGQCNASGTPLKLCRVDLASPSDQARYMAQYPPIAGGNPGISVLTNTSGTILSLSTNPSQFPISSTTPITLTGKVGPALGGATPTGSILFEDTNGTVLGTVASTLTSGEASLTLQNMGSGQHIITTLYSGDSNYQPNTYADGGLVIGVSGTPVTLTFSPSSVAYGSSIYVTITVTGQNGIAPTGSVSLYAYNDQGVQAATQTTLNFTSTNGDASIYSGQVGVDLSPLGDYELYAVYNPGNYPGGSSSNEPLTVTGEAMTLSLNCSPQNTDSGLYPPNQQTCYSQVTDAFGSIVQQGEVVFSMTNGASATEQIGDNVDTNPTFSGYYAVDTFLNPTASYYTMTATFPAGQGLPTGAGGGYYGTGTISASFCTLGPGTCTLPASARSGGVRALGSRSGSAFINDREGLANNVGRFGFQINGYGNRPAAPGAQRIPILRVIHPRLPVIHPQPPIISHPPRLPGPPVDIRPEKNPQPPAVSRHSGLHSPGRLAPVTPSQPAIDLGWITELLGQLSSIDSDPRVRP